MAGEKPISRPQGDEAVSAREALPKWKRDDNRMAWFRSDGACITDEAIMNAPDALARELTLLVLGEATDRRALEERKP